MRRATNIHDVLEKLERCFATPGDYTASYDFTKDGCLVRKDDHTNRIEFPDDGNGHTNRCRNPLLHALSFKPLDEQTTLEQYRQRALQYKCQHDDGCKDFTDPLPVQME